MFETTTETSIPEIKDGTYDAKFSHMEAEPSKYGDIVRWYFDIEYNGDIIQMDAISSAKFTPATKGWRWYENISGKPLKVGVKISDRAIAQNPCKVVIQHKPVVMSNGETVDYPKITDVLPAKTKGK